MLFSRFVALSSTSLALLSTGVAHSQEYPNRPVRIVTTGVGGGNDFIARLLAPALSINLGQQVVVDNRPSGVAPGIAVHQSAPDGYTALLIGGSFYTSGLLQKLPYDPVRDFLPITSPARAPYILLVHPSMPVKSVKDLIALAKARPGEINYSQTTIGAASHIAAESFNYMTGVKIVRVSYRSGSQEVAGLLSGEVQISFFDAGSAMRYMKAGSLRALAIGSAQPSPLFPELPTISATVPGYEAKPMMSGLYVPAKTPDAIIRRLYQEVVRVISLPDVKARFTEAAVEPVGFTPEQFAAEIQADLALTSAVIKRAGIKAD